MNINNIPEIFIEETLAKHWQVNESTERFERLLNHIENRTNFKSYFEQAISHIPWDNEHHRTKKECDKIFRHNGFQPTYFIHDGDLCKDKRYKWETALMWRYYHAVLEYKT